MARIKIYIGYSDDPSEHDYKGTRWDDVRQATDIALFDVAAFLSVLILDAINTAQIPAQAARVRARARARFGSGTLGGRAEAEASARANADTDTSDATRNGDRNTPSRGCGDNDDSDSMHASYKAITRRYLDLNNSDIRPQHFIDIPMKVMCGLMTQTIGSALEAIITPARHEADSPVPVGSAHVVKAICDLVPDYWRAPQVTNQFKAINIAHRRSPVPYVPARDWVTLHAVMHGTGRSQLSGLSQRMYRSTQQVKRQGTRCGEYVCKPRLTLSITSWFS